MIKHIKPLPVSEEMLGAYLEGNLALNDARYIQQMLQDNDELSAFVNELSVSDNLTSDYRMEDIPNFENDFTLPEISTEVGIYLEPQILSLGFEPLFDDVAACALVPDCMNNDDVISFDDLPNADMDNFTVIDVDINHEDCSLDVE